MLSRDLKAFTLLNPKSPIGFYGLYERQMRLYPSKTLETLGLAFGNIGNLLQPVYKRQRENSNIRGGRSGDCVNPHGRWLARP